MITIREKYEVQHAMMMRGGSFIKALGMALAKADTSNTEKIKAAWPDEWEKYRAVYQANLAKYECEVDAE